MKQIRILFILKFLFVSYLIHHMDELINKKSIRNLILKSLMDKKLVFQFTYFNYLIR